MGNFDNLEKFSEQEIPYRTLAKFGLTQEMVDDLPEREMTKLLSSRWTTRLPIIMENEYGERYLAHARIRLIRLSDGEVDVIFAPYCGNDKLSDFSDEQQTLLKQGRVIIADITDKDDGTPHQCYIQMDEKLNQTMHVPVEVIMQNIEILADRLGMDDTDKEHIARGEVSTIMNAGKPISIGVDLHEESAVRTTPGTVQEWLMDNDNERLEKYNIGVYGCWIADEYGDMNYVLEENYTEEIKQEISRRSLQNAAREQLRR